METKKFYSLQEAARLLNVSERSMYRFIDSGELKAHKIRNWRINEVDITAFIESRSNKEFKKK